MKPSDTSIHIIQPGLLSTLQDKGRFGLRHLGIPWAGALCPVWQTLANALVGNDPESAVIECFEGGLHLRIEGPAVRLAIMADSTCDVKIRQTGIETTLKPNRSITLENNSELQILATGNLRYAIVAIEGICIEAHLNSVSTYVKASLGGLDGCALKPADTIPYTVKERHLKPSSSQKIHDQRCLLPKELMYQSSRVRAIPGPQLDHFCQTGIDTLLSACFQISSEADRMGVRLDGPVIAHRDDAAKDIVSDAIVPGSIQVPGTGRAIVLLNDAHTAGGYPKIATVITSDLPTLGLQRTGSPINFCFISIEEAHAIRQTEKELVNQAILSFQPCIQRNPLTRTLLENNLIDGVTDGRFSS